MAVIQTTEGAPVIYKKRKKIVTNLVYFHKEGKTEKHLRQW